MPLSGPPLEPLDVPSLLEVGLTTKPDEIALVSAESRWSWRELDAAADRLARQFLGLGLTPGDRIASLCQTAPSW